MKTKGILKSLHIGVGNRGYWPLKLASVETGFQPVALCDPIPSALEEAQYLYSLPRSACFTDLEEALRTGGADCAIICAPTHLHFSLVQRCITAGLPVLVEKGMASSWHEARELVDFITRHNAKVAVAQNYRYRGPEQMLSRLLTGTDEGPFIGRPFMAIYEQLRVRPEPKNMTYPYASIWDMSCHHFDNLIYWFGPVELITAHAWRAPWSAYTHPQNTSAQIIFRNGTQVHYLHSHDASRASLKVEIHGEQGAAVLTESGVTINHRPLKNFEATPDEPLCVHQQQGEIGVLSDFYNYVVKDIEPGISARHNLEVMATCQMMVLSIEAKCTIRRDQI